MMVKSSFNLTEFSKMKRTLKLQRSSLKLITNGSQKALNWFKQFHVAVITLNATMRVLGNSLKKSSLTPINSEDTLRTSMIQTLKMIISSQKLKKNLHKIQMKLLMMKTKKKKKIRVKMQDPLNSRQLSFGQRDLINKKVREVPSTDLSSLI